MTKLRVFIVDDDIDFAESLAEVLTSRGHHVEMAYSGEDAVERFRDTDFDIAFMDYKLPGKNGVESFFEIRKMKPDAKVMMMTGYRVEHLLRQAVDNGALGVLHKPLAFDDVLEALEKVKLGGLVLIADDDPDFVDSLEDVLTQAGYSVAVAYSGDEAVKKAMENDLEALILDLRMPVINGLDVYLELKKQGRVVPTIIVTGYADEEAATIETLRQESVSGCLVKPFDPLKLLEAIEVAMEAAR
ncbi:response regulator [bacterium AH-315-B06]|nr:response regulator [bacterium AH-315-B06]